MKDTVMIKGIRGYRMELNMSTMDVTIYDPIVVTEDGKKFNQVCQFNLAGTNVTIYRALRTALAGQLTYHMQCKKLCNESIKLTYNKQGKIVSADGRVEIVFSPLTHNYIINVYVDNVNGGDVPEVTFAFDNSIQQKKYAKMLATLNLWATSL